MTPATLDHLDIVTFKWGTLYSADDVNRLRGMVERHLPVSPTFHCVTDDPTGLDPRVVVHDLDEVAAAPWDLGTSRKLSVFQSDFLGLHGRHLAVIDIDMVVVGSLDFLLDRPDADFIAGRGRNQHAGTRAHAALYRIRVGARPQVWAELLADPNDAIASCQHHRGRPGHVSEQRWMDRTITEMAFFPDGYVVYFRQDCGARGRPVLGSVGRRMGLTTARWGTAFVPDGARVVSFAGQAQPRLVQDRSYGIWRRAPFVREHWRA